MYYPREIRDAAKALIQVGEMEWALALGEATAEVSGDLLALADVSLAFARMGEADRAGEVAERSLAILLGADAERISDFNDVVDILVQAGQGERTRRALEQSLLNLFKRKPTERRQRRPETLELALAFAQVGEIDRAAQLAAPTLQQVQSFLERGRGTDVEQPPQLGAAQLTNAAVILAWQGKIDQAVATAMVADRVWSLRTVIESLVRRGKFDQALAAAQLVDDEKARAEALDHLARILFEAGQFDRALRAAEAITIQRDKDWAMRRLAKAFAKAGHLEQAIQIAESIVDQQWKSSILMTITEGFTYAGKPDRAVRVLRTTFPMARVERSFFLNIINQAARLFSETRDESAVERLYETLTSVDHEFGYL
jgi:tetratricopeptide (TPR) repeat protein